MFLAFSSDPANFQTNTIHLIAPDGTDDRLLAQGDSADYSADGSTIVFATVPSTGPLAGFPRLMVSDADGSNMRVVTSSAFGAYAISPDGSRVLVASPSRGDQSPATNRVWIVDLANGTERDLNLTTGDPSTSFENFVWSPDGKSVAFAEIRHVSLATEQGHCRTAYRTAIDVVDLTQATPHAVRVSERPGSASVAIGWSPDSQALAFTGYPDGVAPPTPPLPSPETPGVPDPTQDIFVADLTTGTETNLTNSDSDEYNPRWSPDGKALAYLTGTDTHYVATQPMSGFQPEGGPSVGAMANDFVWSPDGKSLLLAQIIETNNDAGGPGQAAALHGFLQIVQTSNVGSPATLLQSSEAINTVRWQWRPRP
jgi:TolB protein